METSEESIAQQHVVLVRAPNPSAMTLEGTNTYLVALDGRCVVVDPGPLVRGHLDAIDEAVERRGWQVDAVVTTHGHPDHAEALEAAAERLGSAAHPSGVGATATLRELGVEVVPTPGHARDHVCYLLRGRRVLTGDHVLGRGTTAIIYPEGSLEEYLASLSAVAALSPLALLPGHGPAVEGPAVRSTLQWLRDHRAARVAEIAALLPADLQLEVIVDAVYGALGDPMLREAAVRSTLASLVWIARHGEPAARAAAARLVEREGPRHQSLPSQMR